MSHHVRDYVERLEQRSEVYVAQDRREWHQATSTVHYGADPPLDHVASTFRPWAEHYRATIPHLDEMIAEMLATPGRCGQGTNRKRTNQ